jgi:outer membrane protein OmpA-like peptidoglycan-associated protein
MRNKFWSLAALTASLLAGTAIAQTSPQDGTTTSDSWMTDWTTGGRFYVGGQAGGNWINNHTKLNKINPANAINGVATYDDGFIGSLTAGYALPNGFRLQLDLADRYNQVNKVLGYGAAHGSMRNYSGMIDGLYDLPVEFFGFKPYVGVGVGAGDYSADKIRADGMPYPGYFGGDKWDFAYQGIAGVAYNVDDNIALTLEYRYYDQSGDSHPRGVRTDYQSNSALLGVRYTFGEPAHQQAYRAAVYTPTPPAPPAAQSPRNYLVFFDFNKSDLTPDARGIVDKAAQNAKTASVTRLDVTGYTDTVGSDAYNIRLSRRRAESVSAELQAAGIPSSEIAIYAKGKHDLLVPTADGVREPQNRRVQIVYSNGGPNS